MLASNGVKFSLVMATVNRVEPVRRFLAALDRQDYHNFELIVVDQNNDDRLVPELAPYLTRFPVLHLRSPLGLSRARNLGLKTITGDIVGFPDDDCWYAPLLLDELAEWFQQHPEWHGVSGRPTDGEGNTVLGKFDLREGELDFINVWQRANSNTLFLRRATVDGIGGFDEELGVGTHTPWASSEDVDYPLRAIKRGHRILYRPDLRVFHPSLDGMEKSAHVRRAFSYSLGVGRVLRKHRYPLWYLLYNWVGPCKPLLLCLLRGRPGEVRFYAALSWGRFRGWLGWV